MQLAARMRPLESPLDGNDFRGDYPMLAVPEPARAAATKALRQGQTHYVPVAGIQPLKQAIVEFLADTKVHVSADQVIVTGGMQEARFLAVQGVTPLNTAAMLAARGDRQARFLAIYDVVRDSIRIAVPAVADPGVQAALAVRQRHVTVMPVDESAGMLATSDTLEGALADGANLIYIESPSRLTGAMYDETQTRRIAELLKAHDALCVWDQSTAPAVVDGCPSLLSYASERTLAIGMLWPGMGLSAWQVGFVVPPADLAEAIIALKQVLSICTATAPQWAAVGAATVYKQEHAVLLSEMDAARQEALSGLSRDTRVLPGKAVNVIALNLGLEASSRVLGQLQEIQVADGAEFGAPGVVRVTVKLGTATVHAIRLLLGGLRT